MISDFPVTPKTLVQYVTLIEGGKVSNSAAKQKLFPALIEQPNSDVEELAKSLNIIQDASDDEIENLVKGVLDGQAEMVAAYKGGKKNLLGKFMGDVMKAGKGKLDPKTANQMLQKLLNK